jgi:flagellar protein FliO/FliZ
MPFTDLAVALSSLAGVVALVLLSQRLLRPGGRLRPSLSGRLAIVEIRAVDPRRRLVLARLDGREFLLLTGGGGDLLIQPPAGGDAT